MARRRSARFRFVGPTLFLLACGLGPSALGQSILTVAGGGTDEGFPAGKVAMDPVGITYDAKGNLVYADGFNSRVRVIDATTGIVRTLAGTGSGGYSGDGGPATQAELLYPNDVAFDTAGNLYIAEENNGRIRMVSPAGAITTVAGGGTVPLLEGGPATQALLSSPTCLALDPSGFLYFAEYAGRVVRRLDLGTGLLSTVAGTGESKDGGDGGPATKATFIVPWGIARDGAGRLYVSDYVAGKVRRIDTTGTISTFAGSDNGVDADGGPATQAVLHGPAGIAIDAAWNLLIAESDVSRIRRVDAATGVITTVAGTGQDGFSGDGGPATRAQLYWPSGVHVDPEGRIVIADEFNSRLRRIEKDGSIQTIAGNGSFTVIRDGGPATSAGLVPWSLCLQGEETLYIGEYYGYRVRAVDLASGVIRTVAGTGRYGASGDGGPATLAQIGPAAGLAVDRSGGLLVSDPEHHKVRRVDPVTGVITTFAGTGTAGSTGDGGPATLARMQKPRDMAVDANGNVFIADNIAAVVRQVDGRTGIITTVAGGGTASPGDGGPATAAALVNPAGLALDPSGSLLIGEATGNRIRKVSHGIISTVAGNGTTGPFADGLPATQTSFNRPQGIDVDAEGNLYIATGLEHRVRKVDARTGLVSTVAGSGALSSLGDGGPATSAGLANPKGLRVGRSGNLYVADYAGLRVRMVPRCRSVTSPTLVNPSDGATDTSTGPTLSWASVAGAFRYDVYLGTTSPPTTAVATDLSATSYTPVNLQPGTRYYWKVVAKGDPYCVPFSSAESAVRSFTTASSCAAPSAPSLTAPADGAKVPASAATLSWAASPGAGTYDVSFGATNPPPLAASGLTSTSWTPPALDVGGLYYWSVLAHAACDPVKTASSGVRSFRIEGVGCVPPGAFSLSSPADGATSLPPDLTISWAASPGAASYDLYLGLSSSPPLYLSGLTSTAFALRGLAAGATYRWKVVARAACDPAAATSTALRSFTVRGTCAAPGAPSFNFLPPGAVGTGQTYVVAWSAASGLGAGDGYVVERSTSPSFTPLLDAVTTSTLFASFVAPSPGSVYHRVRAVPACDPAKAGPWSSYGLVSVTSATPNVVFSRPPEAIVLALGDRLEDRKSLFSLENVTSSSIQVFLGRQELSSPPFFTITDPAGGDAAVLTLEPHVPKLLEVHYSGPRNDVAGAYQGVIFAASVGAGLAVTPWAYVSLKVGSSPDAVPEFRVSGVSTEYAAFPGLSGSDTGRAPLSVDVFNPGSSPLELAAEVGPELWLSLEPGWNATPIPAGGTRTLRLSTVRMRAPNGSALPRYTYLTLRTRGGKTSRLLVQDNDAPLLSAGRGASAVRPEASFLVPSVAHVTSALGNTFVSRLSLSNSGTEAVQTELVFTPASSDSKLVDGFDTSAIRRATVIVPPNDLVRLSDPLVLLFGMAPPVSGTLEVRSPASRAGFLSVASSVDAPSIKGGTFGFALPVFRSGQGIRAGSSAAITAVASDAAERTNLILAETTGVDSAVARVSLYDRDGKLVGTESVSVPRWGQRQLSSVIGRLGGAFGSRAARLEVSVESGGGTLAAVTTVVDNFNDDAAAFSARAVDSQGSVSRTLRALKPLWARATGTAKSLVPALVNGYRTFPAASEPFTFRSVMGFSSLSSAEALFRLTYYDRTSGSSLYREVRVGGRKTVEYANVLEQLFGIGEGVPSQGPLFVESDPQGLLWCRVASSLAQGTIGDSFPVVPIPSESLSGGADSRLLEIDGLEQSVDRSRGTRSNLILNEVSGRPVTLLVSLYEAGNRSSPIATREVRLGALEKVQLSTVFSDLGLDQDDRRKDRTNVLCTVRATSGEGLASAVVTTIDNRTGDTRNIPLALSASGAPGVAIGF